MTRVTMGQGFNMLADVSAELIAEVLKTNRTVTKLWLVRLKATLLLCNHLLATWVNRGLGTGQQLRHHRWRRCASPAGNEMQLDPDVHSLGELLPIWCYFVVRFTLHAGWNLHQPAA